VWARRLFICPFANIILMGNLISNLKKECKFLSHPSPNFSLLWPWFLITLPLFFSFKYTFFYFQNFCTLSYTQVVSFWNTYSFWHKTTELDRLSRNFSTYGTLFHKFSALVPSLSFLHISFSFSSLFCTFSVFGSPWNLMSFQLSLLTLHSNTFQ